VGTSAYRKIARGLRLLEDLGKKEGSMKVPWAKRIPIKWVSKGFSGYCKRGGKMAELAENDKGKTEEPGKNGGFLDSSEYRVQESTLLPIPKRDSDLLTKLRKKRGG